MFASQLPLANRRFLHPVTSLCLFIGRDLDRDFGRDMERFGLRPYHVDAVDAALELVGQWGFDAVLLDGDSSSGPAARALAALRDCIRAPILLLAGAADEDSQIRSLESGATVVLVKPASALLAAAKLRSLIEYGARPRVNVAASTVAIGPLRLDLRRRQARLGELMPDLTRAEFELLLQLADHPGELVPRRTPAGALDRDGGRADSRSVDMHISRIRRKLGLTEASGLTLETVHGRGYVLRFVAPARSKPTPAGAAL